MPPIVASPNLCQACICIWLMTYVPSMRGSETHIQVMPLGVLSIVRMPNESKASYMCCSCMGVADAIVFIWLWAVTSLCMCRTMMYSEQPTSTEIT